MSARHLPFRYWFVPLSLLASLVSGCGAADPQTHEIAMAPLHAMPMEVQSAPERVQQAYQFAVANPETLSQIPCYCGCGPLGHASNLDCYVAGMAEDGSVTFDQHALGCLTCVDITQDTMRLLRQGRSAAQIKDYVDTAYAQYGPSNMP
ncbi:MAG: hypothetical protein IT329_23950 [Caldilineaceae bacterium]|nr:hypothetical protein [Caldilineaceae bacterium]